MNRITLLEGEAKARNEKRPLLSLIVGARNDSYMGDFKWRFETSVNYLADNLQRIGRLGDVEMVVTDWGSDVPLHTALSLNRYASQMVRFVMVPPDLAREKQGESEFPIVIVQNTAVRRCRGEYIAQTDSDILFPVEYLKKLFEIFDNGRILGRPLNRSYVISKRRHIPWEYINRSPEISEIDWFIRHWGRLLPLDVVFDVPNLGTYAGTAFVMIHRSVWEEYCGYDERLVHYGFMDIDFALRVVKKYPCIFLEDAGLRELYHLEHYPALMRFRPPRPRNPVNYEPEPVPNGENWGLGDYDLGEFSCEASANSVEAAPMQSSRWLRVSYILSFRFVIIALWRYLRSEMHWKLPWLAQLWKHRINTVFTTLTSEPLRRWPHRIRSLYSDWRLRQRNAATK